MGLIRGCEMTLGYIAHTVFRFVQLIFALAVCGLYGADLHTAHKMGQYSDGKWVYAVVVGSFSAVSSVVYMIPFICRIPLLFIWDTILFILWIALFGVFGNMYIHANPEGDSGIQRMKNAVWVDLINALLWLASAVGMLAFFVKGMSPRSRFTGRAAV